MKRPFYLIATIVIAALPTLSWADWLCTSKERDWPPAQQELFRKVATALRASLLPPPEGWVMATPDVRTPGGKMCADFKNDPVTFGSSVTYIIKPTADELRRYRASQMAQRRELDELQKLPPDVQSKAEALDAEASKARKEGRDAERAKDKDLAKTKYDEGTAFLRKAYEVRSAHTTSVAPKQREIYRKYEKDMTLNLDTSIMVSLEANGQAQPSDVGAERIAFGAKTKTNQATDRLVRVTATINRNERVTPAQFAIAKGLIDKAMITAMIGGAIPSLEESNAAIAKQNEAITQLNAKARELVKSVEAESRQQDDATKAAERAAKSDKADKTDKPVASPTPVAASTVPATSATPAAAPAKPDTPAPSDAANQAKDTVNKLRGLFGR